VAPNRTAQRWTTSATLRVPKTSSALFTAISITDAQA
jgi:hypothetical protein